MTEFEEAMEFEHNDMMDGILDEASGAMSPTLTPFLSLGTDDPAMAIMDGPSSSKQAEAKDLFESFDTRDASEDKLRRSGLYRDEAAEI